MHIAANLEGCTAAERAPVTLEKAAGQLARGAQSAGQHVSQIPPAVPGTPPSSGLL